MTSKVKEKVLKLESDSDSDSDYAPDLNEENDVGDKEVKEVGSIPLARKRKAAALFEDMRAEHNKEVENKMQQAMRYQTKEQTERKTKHKKKKLLKNLMTTIFGSKSEVTKKFSSSSANIDVEAQGNQNSIDKKSGDVIKTAKDIVKNVKKHVILTETKKFAGKEISVEKAVFTDAVSSDQPNASKSSIGGNKKQDSSLDKVLEDIKGPQALSTVSKSSMDWDSYKDKEGLEEDLADAKKEGYITRQEFLERCDYRAFEKERDQRLLNSSKK